MFNTLTSAKNDWVKNTAHLQQMKITCKYINKIKETNYQYKFFLKTYEKQVQLLTTFWVLNFSERKDSLS